MSIQQKQRDKLIDEDEVLKGLIVSTRNYAAKSAMILEKLNELILQRTRQLNLLGRTDFVSDRIMSRIEKDQLKKLKL